jgi:membrane protease YdiL (CAAX protease family)
MAKLKNYFADTKREFLFTLFFLLAMLVFPWLAFMFVRLIATFFQIQPNSLTGNLMSAFPNLIIALLAIAFLKIDDWDFSAIGISLRKVLPGLIFAVLALAGLYTILPLGMSIFFEPRTLMISFQGFNSLYLVLFIRGWFIVGISEELASRGFLLNKAFSLLPKAIRPTWKKIWAVLFTLLFFSLINYIRLRTAGNMMVSTNTILTYFAYGILVSYLYLRTNNLFVAGFMQSAFIFPPFGLTVGKEFALSDPGFIVSFFTFVLFIVLLAETYTFWGKPLEFEKKTNSDLEIEPIDETQASEASAD